MKKIIFIPIIILFFSCTNSHDKKEVVSNKNLELYKAQYKEYFSGTNSKLTATNSYFQMKNFDLEGMTDTILKINDEIFEDESIKEIVNNDIADWLRDSIFIGSSKTRKGSFVLDTTNMLTLKNPSKYYTNSEIKKGQAVRNKLFQKIHSPHMINIDGQKIYYYIRPGKEKLVKEIGQYRVETTKDYLPTYEKNRNKKYDIRHFCDLYIMDFYIIVRSKAFFKGTYAFKIKDSTYYYVNDLSRIAANEKAKMK